MNYTEYARRNPTGKKFVLLTIDPEGTPVRFATAGFITSPTDPTLPNTVFKGTLDRAGVPRISRSVGDLWGGRGVSSWGKVTLINPLALGGLNLIEADLYGKKIDMRITGHADVVSYAESMTTLVGYVRSKSGVFGGGLTLSLADRGKQLETLIPLARYSAATESAYFPEGNEGKPKQIVMGTCPNVPTVLIDTNLNKYQVSDPAWPVTDILNVYVNGVAVAFTKNLANNTFTLSSPANSNETVTASVTGVKLGGSLASTHAELITWVLKEFTPFDTDPQIEISGLPSGAAQYLISSDFEPVSVLNDLAKSCLSQFFVTPQDTVKITPLPLPAAGGVTLGMTKHLRALEWEEVEEIYYRIPVTYANNFAQLTTLGAVPDKDFEIWLKSENSESYSEDAAVLTAYANAGVASTVKTYFVNKADAEAVADAALVLYGTQRYYATVTVPYVAPAIALLDSVEIVDVGILSGDWVVHGIDDDFSGAVPIVSLRVWK